MSKRILLIVHTPKIREAFKKFILEMGYAVKICLDAKSSIEMVASFSPNLILCEADLPIISGYELGKLFKSNLKYSKIPLVLITTQLPSRQSLTKLNVQDLPDDFVPIPFDQSSFYGVLTKWLESEEHPETYAQKILGTAAPTEKSTDTKPSWQHGKVNLATMTSLFLRLAQRNETGTLELRGVRRKMNILVQNGKVLEVRSNYIREDSFGRFLIDQKRITPQESAASIKKAAKEKVPQGHILVKLGFLTKAELFEFLTKQKTMKFFNLFKSPWEGASFDFRPDNTQRTKGAMKLRTVGSLLKIAVFRHASAHKMYQLLSEAGLCSKSIILGNNLARFTSLLSFKPEEVSLAYEIDQKSIDQLKTFSPKEFPQLLRIAFLFLMAQATSEKTSPVKPKTASPKSSKKPSRPRAAARPTKPASNGLALARKLIAQKKYIDAEPLLQSAWEDDPDNSEILMLLGWMQFCIRGDENRKEAMKAKDLLKKAFSTDDHNDEALVYMGLIFKTEGKDILAESHFTRALQLNPDNESAKREVRLLSMKKRKNDDFGFRS